LAWIRLPEALERYRREEDAYTNSYEWYRRDAHRSGSVSVDGVHIPARKIGRAWSVDEDELARAIDAHRQRIAARKEATIDYSNHVLRGRGGDSIETDWGWYEIRGAFHLASYRSRRPPPFGGGDECWFCNSCWQTAETEHDREECHRYENWGSCGRDCTLSRVFCAKCGTSLGV
jgi:hypothetical protein